MALEEAANIKIDDADVANLKTVGDILDYLNTHKGVKSRRGHRPPAASFCPGAVPAPSRECMKAAACCKRPPALYPSARTFF